MTPASLRIRSISTASCCRAQSAIKPSISSWFSPRAVCVTKRGSSAGPAAPPAAEGVAPVEGARDPLRREHAGERVAERDVEARRRLAGEAVDVTDPAHRLGDRGEAGALGGGPGLPVAGDAGEDELWVRLTEAVPAEVPFLERPRAEVLDEDVASLREPEQELLPSLLAPVQRDAPLV